MNARVALLRMAREIQRLRRQLDGANERAAILLDAKNRWADRARVTEAALRRYKVVALRHGAQLTKGTPMKNPITLDLPAELIIGNRMEFRGRMAAAINGGADDLTLDFANTRYVDSSGLGVLYRQAKDFERIHGRRVRIVNLSEDLTILFALTKIDTAFDVVSEPAETRG